MSYFGWYRWFLSQTLPDRLQIICLVILALTAIVVAYYTYETYRLRKVSQMQYRASFKPVIVLALKQQDYSTRGPGRLALQEVTLKNIGNGPAFNVQVLPITYNGYSAEFERIDVVGEAEISLARFSVLQNGKASGLSRLPPIFEAMLVSQNSSDTVTIPVEISYLDSAGLECKTTAAIEVSPVAGMIMVRFKSFT